MRYNFVMTNILFILFAAFSTQSLDFDFIYESSVKKSEKVDPFPHKKEVEQKMHALFLAMAAGEIPLVGAKTQYYTGSCITSYSASDVPQLFSATLALRTGVNGNLDITYTTGQGAHKNYTMSEHADYLEKMYVPKARPSEVIVSETGGKHLKFTMGQLNGIAIVAFLSAEPKNKDLIYFIAPLMGYNCELNLIR